MALVYYPKLTLITVILNSARPTGITVFHVVPCQMLFKSPDRQDLPLYCCPCLRVYELVIEIEQACQAAAFVSEAMMSIYTYIYII